MFYNWFQLHKINIYIEHFNFSNLNNLFKNTVSSLLERNTLII